MKFNTDVWYTEAPVDLGAMWVADEEPPMFIGSIARPDVDSHLSVSEKRCTRCGVIRSIKPSRAIHPLCFDCKSVLTKDQRKAWKK